MSFIHHTPHTPWLHSGRRRMADGTGPGCHTAPSAPLSPNGSLGRGYQVEGCGGRGMRVLSPRGQALTLAGGVALVLGLWSAGPGGPSPRPGTGPGPEESPEARQEAVALRIFAKDLVASEVAAGRRSLFEAAALFGALNRVPPQASALSLMDSKAGGPRVPARTDEERLCRQVIVWAPTVLTGWPADEARSVTDRLEAEFWEELRERGVIRLPDP